MLQRLDRFHPLADGPRGLLQGEVTEEPQHHHLTLVRRKCGDEIPGPVRLDAVQRVGFGAGQGPGVTLDVVRVDGPAAYSLAHLVDPAVMCDREHERPEIVVVTAKSLDLGEDAEEHLAGEIVCLVDAVRAKVPRDCGGVALPDLHQRVRIAGARSGCQPSGGRGRSMAAHTSYSRSRARRSAPVSPEFDRLSATFVVLSGAA